MQLGGMPCLSASCTIALLTMIMMRRRLMIKRSDVGANKDYDDNDDALHGNADNM